MARKQITVSDISGKDIAEGEEATLVVSDHPALGGRSVELDIERSEAARIEDARLTLVSVAIKVPGDTIRRVILDAAAFDKLFKGDVSAILQNARPGGASPAPAKRRARSTAAPARARAATGPVKIDYTSESHFGQLHRGRVTEDEAALVRDNLEQANKNRVAAGQPEIDPEDPKEKKRYGF